MSRDACLGAVVSACILIASFGTAHAVPRTSSVTLEWTAPGDDGQVGAAAAYDLRFAEMPISDETWDAATPVRDLPKPAGAGKREKIKVRGLEPGRKYYFAVRAVDEAGNWSSLSNVANKAAPDPAAAPAQFPIAMSAPWPCPARNYMRLEITLPAAGAIHVNVHDIAGRRVKTLAEGPYPAGTTLLQWDFIDERGRSLPFGQYWVVGVLGDTTITTRLTRIP